ncbi:DUF1592 domain-containing protein [Rubritalea spongiae]|uniref:DUF1592 domain-containing protein n=1 Tax=Rubritalea spongiae TaxID=430797 RepID=A0ABW5E343_9BACT
MKVFPFLGLFVILTARLLAQGEYSPIVPFFQKYCVECHGPDKQKGDVRLDNVREITADLWIEIYEQMKYGDMPPEEADQAPKEHTADIIQLVDAISRDDRFTIGSGYRRLNKREYRNTVRDLLGLSDEYFDPAQGVFDDEIEKGFDTNSTSLIITNELLLEYLRSASISLETALFTDDFEKPQPKKTTFTNKQFTVDGQLSSNGKDYAIQRQRKGGIYPKRIKDYIPATGYYRMTTTAMGMGRTPDKKKAGPFRMSLIGSFAGTTKELKEFNIKDDKMGRYSAVVWLEKGALPYYQGTSVSIKPRNINRHRKPENALPIPALAIKDITIEGPIDVEWPPVTYKTTFQSQTMPNFEDRAVRDQILRNFISRAFRRQVHITELKRYTEYLEDQYKINNNWLQSFIRTFAAIMASTDFLYIKEEVGELTPFQLASRLSYFLWSSMPDMELFALANTGELLDPKVYREQVSRMIRDPKAKHFIEAFPLQWLSVDELGTMRPAEDDKQFSIYYKKNLEPAMREETLKFFEYVLIKNKPITDFLDSDYTFVNKDLAQLYDIPFDGDDEMKLVKLPSDSVRGGLLGQASIHAITSNGVETLPVTRGHWVLDELMGTPPPPAPEEVPALVPDLNGVTTQRELLKRHSEDPKCFGCHKVMDPPGLALESFDVIGRYRTTYNGNAKIDPSGNFQGTRFDDIRGLKKALLKQTDTFTYNFIVKIAEYGKGRKLNRQDHDLVEEIAAKAKAKDYKFMYILGDILLSDLMKSR